MSYIPLGHGDSKLISESIFKELGEKYGKSPAQIILKWHIQKGFIVIPGSKNISHIRDNFDINDFELSDEDMEKIASLDSEKRYYYVNDDALNGYANFKLEYEAK